LPKHLNDDRLGRALDKYYQTGTTKIFTAIALKAAHKFQVKMNSIHLDGSSMYVQGAYKKESEAINEIEKEASEADTEIKPIEIVHGYSRDHRPDLKQFIIDMIVTGDGDVPLYLKIGKDSGLRLGNKRRHEKVTRMGRYSLTEKSHCTFTLKPTSLNH